MFGREYSIDDLVCETGFSKRTIQYYITLGMLPGASGQGRGATYGDEHLQRLKLIAHMKANYLPIEEIKRRLAGLSPDEIAALLDEMPQREAVHEHRDVTGFIHELMEQPYSRASPESRQREQPPVRRGGRVEKAERTDWRRVTLAPGVEIHLRAGLPPEMERRARELIELGERIFEES